ncbi:NifB/NifX family molybdenum-iron cluster-binding protein [Thermococcus sp.]|uniref:NifB/NifX family molybdenum-iron cluster-binding protein n=2 Tax=Thermococcus sp. TaxID=35749 RepID=UPI002632AC2B|nr:NifB/NifX family molybdenum-iron cluster-binding protein [Thermococcus sp.]
MQLRVAIPTGKGGLGDRIHESLVRAPTFTLVLVRDGEVAGVEVVGNPYSREPYGAGSKVALFLVSLGVDAVVSRMDCPKGKAIFNASGVKIVKVEGPLGVLEALDRLGITH